MSIINDEYEMYLKTQAWQKKRSKRLKIDNYTCQMCGSKKNLQVHHLNYIHFGNEDIYNDLITLCIACHSKIERAKKEGEPCSLGIIPQTNNVQQFENEGEEVEHTTIMPRDGINERIRRQTTYPIKKEHINRLTPIERKRIREREEQERKYLFLLIWLMFMIVIFTTGK